MSVLPLAVTVRGAEERDLDTVCRIEQASFADPWSRRSFRGLLAGQAAFFLVAEAADGGVVGYAAGYVVADEAELSNIAVDVARRRGGVGRVLLHAAQEWARVHGAASFYLDVRAGNASALALYEREGFEPVGRRKRYYAHPTEDAIVMRKGLVPAARN